MPLRGNRRNYSHRKKNKRTLQTAIRSYIKKKKQRENSILNARRSHSTSRNTPSKVSEAKKPRKQQK